MFRSILFLVLFLAFPLQGEDPFTAKVIKKKVRLRASPAIESPIVRELTQGDLIVVDGEQENFYQFAPRERLNSTYLELSFWMGQLKGAMSMSE